MASYKQKCGLCKKNWALMRSGYQRFAVCQECEMKVIAKPVKNPKMKKLFDIPQEWYRENHFLRSVRYQYGRFGDITPKQADAFKATVDEMRKNGGKPVRPAKKDGTIPSQQEQHKKKKKEA